MFSNVIESAGFGLLTLAAYELSGRVGAFVTLGVILLFVGVVLDDVKLRLPARLRKKQEPTKKGLRLVDEPLTNSEMDLLGQAAEDK